MPNNRYIDYPMIADARDLMQRCFDYMAAKFTGWEPSEGQIDVAILEATSSEAADIASLATQVPKSIFRYYGAQILGIPPEDAVSATCTTTWEAITNIGHTIPSGTQVSIADVNGNVVPFVTVGDVTIETGDYFTDVGGVVIAAVTPGTQANGIPTHTNPVVLGDVLPWVVEVVQETDTSGGKDPESDDQYLNRLALELTTLSSAPILPRDFAYLAKNVAGVQRATAIDGYDPSGPTSGNERMVCIVALDSAGVGVSSGIRTSIVTYLDSLREVNFDVKTTTPTSNTIDVTTTVLLNPAYSQTDVQQRITDALTQFLNPAQWGVDVGDDPNDPSTWVNKTKLTYLELGKVIGSVPGVLLIESLTFKKTGGSLATTDVTLTGVAPIPTPGALNVTVSLT